MATKKQKSVKYSPTGDKYEPYDVGAVRFDETTSLTDAQKARARQNIGAGTGADMPATTNLLRGNGSGGAVAATPGTDYVVPTSSSQHIAAHNEDYEETSALELDSGAYMTATGTAGIDAASDVNITSEDGDINLSAPSGHLYFNGDEITPGGGGGADLPETTNLIKGDGTGGALEAEPGTDYATPEQVNAKYTKPSGGIPASDLASGVQTSLGKADTALQSVPNTYRTASAQDEIDNAQNTAINAKYTKPSSGIPASDLASGVIPTFKIEPDDAIYRINNHPVAAKYDADGNEITVKYALKRRVVTTVSGSNLTIADNTEYDLTNIEVLNISYPTGKFECYMKLTLSTGSSISISFPAGTTYIGTAPQFGVGETWEISIKDGVVIAGKAVSS